MINRFFRKLSLIASDAALRNRVLFLVGALAAFRFLAAIPVPGVNRAALEQFFANNQFFGLLNVFSGGGLSQLSVVMLGVGPYITSSIIMQLATVIFPNIKRMYTEEGEAGRAKFIQISRGITIPLAIVQAFGFLELLTREGIIASLNPLSLVANVLLVSAGSILLMWLGELVTEFGVGNGVSLIIFAGIASRIPSGVSQALYAATLADIPSFLGFAALALVSVFAVVVVSDAERAIPIAYARQVRGAAMSSGAATYLPIRLLQAGVIPIIFALSLLLLPQMAFSVLSATGATWATAASTWYSGFVANPWEYGTVYFFLVILFTYFYTSITFEPTRVAENLQKTGAFIPGVRPGRETETFIENVVNRVTLPGAVFLGLLAVIPFIIQGLTGITALLIGGTALLIAVQVVLDLVQKIDAQISLREY
ncbi:MAG: preprotein translocase subunit SecY [Patescibacteria group bacterium]|nr:preprotein translocase subunit SecY [Patescibacteria group bacterium]MDE1966329.1 preprotein translocase subunit SecY [Patescibacteria group bacterium]